MHDVITATLPTDSDRAVPTVLENGSPSRSRSAPAHHVELLELLLHLVGLGRRVEAVIAGGGLSRRGGGGGRGETAVQRARRTVPRLEWESGASTGDPGHRAGRRGPGAKMKVARGYHCIRVARGQRQVTAGHRWVTRDAVR